MDGLAQSRLASMLSLFTSGSTLVCCAIPALLVAIGAGAALSSAVSAVPQLVWISEHKEEIFLTATAMLVLSGVMQWQAAHLPCPVDPALAAACTRTRKISSRVYLISVALYLVGGFFAFAAPLLID